MRRHDIGVDPRHRPEAFDLVHARLLLEHVTSRDVALDIMAHGLWPGGWLLIESADPRLQPLACPDEVGNIDRSFDANTADPNNRAGNCRLATRRITCDNAPGVAGNTPRPCCAAR